MAFQGRLSVRDINNVRELRKRSRHLFPLFVNYEQFQKVYLALSCADLDLRRLEFLHALNEVADHLVEQSRNAIDDMYSIDDLGYE